MSKEKSKRLTSPRGRAVYPYLNKPDTKWKPEGEYHTKLAVPAKLGEELVAIIDAAHKQSFEDAKEIVAEKRAKGDKKVKDAKECEDLPYSYDEEKDEYVFSFKMRASGKNSETKETWTQKPALFNAKGKPLEKTIRVGGGSVLRISFEIVPFFAPKVGAGVSLRMRAVQIIELKEFGTGDASAHGFGEEDGSFSGEDDVDGDEDEGDDEETDESSEDADGDGSDF